MKLKSKDLILHLLMATGREPKEAIFGITRFQKMVFLFEKEIWPEFKFDKLIPEYELPKFEPYHYGPFSEGVVSDIEFLVNLGFVNAEDISYELLDEEERLELQLVGSLISDKTIRTSTKFSISSKGIRFVESGRAGHLSSIQRGTLEKFKLKCTSVPLAALLNYVYVKYPKMITRSLITKEVLGFDG